LGLTELANSKEKFASEISSKQLGLIDILRKFDLKPSLEHFFQISQRIMPRYYTIASSSKAMPGQIRIAISLTHDDKLGKYGQASKFLKEAAKGTQCNIFVKDSMFEMPTNSDTDMIMIGPGTGIVPFIGFTEEMQM
jgi:sulfite reductase (NADPH) flavoprotein alpha-component